MLYACPFLFKISPTYVDNSHTHINILKRNGSRAGSLVSFRNAGSLKASFLPQQAALFLTWENLQPWSMNWSNDLEGNVILLSKKWNKTHLLDCPIALDFVPAFLSPCWWVFYTSSPDCSWQGQKGFCSKSTQVVCDSYSHRILCLGNDGMPLVALFSPEYLWFLLVPGWWDWSLDAGAGASLIFSAL